MSDCLLHKTTSATRRARFYRIEIAANLFQEYSVLREWGQVGGKGRQLIRLYKNLREASRAADSVREKTLKRGYVTG